MNIKEKYQKIERPKEALGSKMLVLLKDNSILCLDAISLYIWENSTGHTLRNITKLLISACENSEQLSFNEIQEDCNNVIIYLINNGLISQEGWEN